MDETPENPTGQAETSRSRSPDASKEHERDDALRLRIALPAHVAGSGTLDRLVDTARDGRRVLDARLSDKHVARLIKATVLKSGTQTQTEGARDNGKELRR